MTKINGVADSYCQDSLFVVDINLEADNVSILNLALSERQLRLHELNHARFDFLKYAVSDGI